jgi:hypothetical protein
MVDYMSLVYIELRMLQVGDPRIVRPSVVRMQDTGSVRVSCWRAGNPGFK